MFSIFKKKSVQEPTALEKRTKDFTAELESKILAGENPYLNQDFHILLEAITLFPKHMESIAEAIENHICSLSKKKEQE